MNLTLLQVSPDILGLMLFGSTARKDADVYSDKDIFVLCQDLGLDELLRIKSDFILPSVGQAEGICCYKHKDVVIMAEKGSLFLWHLKLQGRIVFSKNGVLENIFSILKSYDKYQEDLTYYRNLLADVNESLKKWNVLSEFDLSLLFTIARNTCMLLCYHKGMPKFGRSNVYLTARKIFGKELPMVDWLYPKLCSWKLWYERGIKPEGGLPGRSMSYSMIEQLSALLEFARKQCS